LRGDNDHHSNHYGGVDDDDDDNGVAVCGQLGEVTRLLDGLEGLSGGRINLDGAARQGLDMAVSFLSGAAKGER
jgi:hypothetical protein